MTITSNLIISIATAKTMNLQLTLNITAAIIISTKTATINTQKIC